MLDDDREEELWRLRAIELDRDQWRANARNCGEVLEAVRSDRDAIRADLTLSEERRRELVDENAKLAEKVGELASEVKILKARVNLEEDHNFKVMDFRIMERHWTVDDKHQIIPPGSLYPVLLEYK